MTVASSTLSRLKGNAILSALPARELRSLAERMELMDVAVRERVYDPGTAIPHVYFPLGAVFSLVATADGRATAEVATIGREGMVGLPVFLGAEASPHAAFCQIPGPAARMSARDFRSALNHDGALHGLLRRFTQSTIVQIAQSVLCNNAHSLHQRAARWLLTSHDRVGQDEFQLTQEFLAQMLGARRPTVSLTAKRLQSEGMITYRRGLVTIADRRKLERSTCQCYWIVKQEFDDITRTVQMLGRRE